MVTHTRNPQFEEADFHTRLTYRQQRPETVKASRSIGTGQYPIARAFKAATCRHPPRDDLSVNSIPSTVAKAPEKKPIRSQNAGHGIRQDFSRKTE